MIRKLKSGYRLYSRKKYAKTGKRTNLGTFKTRAAAKKHERAVQYFKRRRSSGRGKHSPARPTSQQVRHYHPLKLPLARVIPFQANDATELKSNDIVIRVPG